jgi:DNA polymerase III alpha subunit
MADLVALHYSLRKEQLPFEYNYLREDIVALENFKRESNPLYRSDWVDKFKHLFSNDIKSLEEILQIKKEKIKVKTGGLIYQVRFLTTKNNKNYSRITLYNSNENIEVMIWSEQLEKYRDQLMEGKIVEIKGKTNIYNDKLSIILDEIKTIFIGGVECESQSSDNSEQEKVQL